MDAYSTLYTTGGVPALVSTAITIIYFAVKLIAYVLHASTRETESQKRMLYHHLPTHNQSSMSGMESPCEIYKDISGNSCETDDNGRRQWPRSPRTILLPNGGQNVCFSPNRNAAGNQTMPPLQTNVEGCGGQRSSHTRDNISPGPQGPHINATGVFTKSRRGHDATDEKSQHIEGDGGESWTSRSDEVHYDGIP